MLDEIALELRLLEVFIWVALSRPIFFGVISAPYFAAAISARISSTFQALVLGDNFTGLG